MHFIPDATIVIANSTLKQLIIPEYHMGVYQKEDANTKGRHIKSDEI